MLLDCQDNENVSSSGGELIKLKTDDKILDYISLMSNNICPCTIAFGKKTHVSYQNNKNLLETRKLKEEPY